MDKPTIWVVDDDPSVQRAMRRLLESMSCACEVFSNGDDLLAAIAGEQPDLVILDIHMPGPSGLDVLAALRAGGMRVPVVLVTGVEREGVRETSRAGGALDVLSKPVGAAEIGAMLLRIGRADPSRNP